MKRNANGKQVYTTESIADWLSRYRASGLGVERFARQHRIPPGRLHYWLYQKGRQQPVKPATTPVPLFQELQVALGPAPLGQWAAELVLPKGLTLRLSAAAAPGWIGEVIKALQEPC